MLLITIVLRQRFDKEDLVIESMRMKNYPELLTEEDSGEVWKLWLRKSKTKTSTRKASVFLKSVCLTF